MDQIQIKNLENMSLVIHYEGTKGRVWKIREEIISNLSNLFFVSEKLKKVDHDNFDRIIQRDYKWKVNEDLYENFIEQKLLQEDIEKEIEERIKAIKGNTAHKLTMKLCKNLAGSDINIDNFLAFDMMITYIEDLKTENGGNKEKLLQKTSPEQLN